MSTPLGPRPRWGPVRSLLCLAPLLLVPFYSFKLNYALPEPITDPVNPITGLPQISEANALAHAKYLSEDIGYRTVGTREHALGDAWMLQQAELLHAQCEEVLRVHPGRRLQCEVWHQQGSGSHRFDMMGRRLYKTYVDLTNVIIRVSDGTPAGKEHAVLVNSHVDSTLPSPGGADDAISVGIMMECVRVLVNTPDWEPKHAIIFLFNNAEESLQDGSHLFATQHPVAKTVRAFINLEAAGTTGQEMLFQATSEQMIRAYSYVPRPFGTIIASEVFSSGIILSDTDFRQFEQYLNVTGLDIAIVSNSYLYHMRNDLVENIEPGVTQHMGENVLALLLYLSSPESPLPTLTEGYTRPTTVFFQYLGYFYLYSFRTANTIYLAMLVTSLILAKVTYVDPAPALKKGKGLLGEHAKGILAVSSAFVGSLVGANVVAVVMRLVLGKGMSWFSSEWSCVALYGPAALAGGLASQLLVGRVPERTVFSSVLLLQSFLTCALQFVGIGSSALYFLSCVGYCAALVLNAFVTNSKDDISLWSYLIGQLNPLMVGTQIFCITLDVFVPLTGRMGQEAPAEHIIASIVAFTGGYSLPLAIPFVHRFSHRMLARMVILMSVLTAVMMVAFSMRSPFDAMHQKRLFVIHMENVTSEEQHLHVAAADGAPGFDVLAQSIARDFGVEGMDPTSVILNSWSNYWESMYPFSEFLTPYKFDLPLKPDYLVAPEHDFTITAANDTIDAAAGTRSLTLVINHPGIIWTAIVFDAHVLKWNLDDNPPDEYARHHIKEASFYGHDTWTVDLVIKLPPGADAKAGLRVDFVGIHEKAMWPGKKAEKAEGGRAMVLFEEFDAWIEKEMAGTVDTLLIGGVGGVAVV
ncbi:Putative endoplasmic reticulum metallopeptidase [Sparassis crispa]|uniref:Peptide hydrolase n=1 Tax=Sparassis crispa TaxID=139825 RepID=A0A401H556_9APHY|nr:Putative endoplasmic reticulum metallopeptidase [Sparassis crispa]GBE89509.1 Putative endoplasmic reticulum metallopeptidase [Sparassis crispa]